LMPAGALPRTHTELLILRTAYRCDCPYEWRHHERLAHQAGLTAQEIAAVRESPPSQPSRADHRLLLAAADELLATRRLSDQLWTALRATYDDAQLIELCMLVGHYQMLAMTINALRIEPDPPPRRRPPHAIRLPRRQLIRNRKRIR